MFDWPNEATTKMFHVSPGGTVRKTLASSVPVALRPMVTAPMMMLLVSIALACWKYRTPSSTLMPGMKMFPLAEIWTYLPSLKFPMRKPSGPR
ncbi:hypothetical protein D3C87_1626530 [compost metagenome]